MSYNIKNTFFLLIVMISIINVRCKKDELSSSNNSNTSLIIGGETVTRTITKHLQTNTSDTILGINFMYFYPATDIISGTGAYPYDVGSVSVNSVIFQKYYYYPNSPSYSDTTNTFKTFPLNISISGNGSVHPYSYTDNGNWIPSFSNTSQIPTTISKSAGVTFTLSNVVNNPDGIEVYLDNCIANCSNNVVTFTPNKLNVVSTSTTAVLRITCKWGYSVREISGNNYYCGGEFKYNIYGITVTP